MSTTHYLLCTILVFMAPIFGSAQMGQIEESISIKMVPNLNASANVESYKVGNNVRFKIIVNNNSFEVKKVLVVDTYYQNRPKVFKDGKLVPYRKGLASLLQSKDKDPRFIRPGRVISLGPKEKTTLGELILTDWYGPLEPGVYRLVNRFRFEMAGPWSAQSEGLEFEIVPEP
jgi:hypothetical protein